MTKQIREALLIIRRKRLEELTGLSRSTIYARINPKSPTYDPSFPRPIELGQGMKNPPVGWVESEVDAWLHGQVQKSRNAA
ncbi:helix-turn-helix transcriptional regulator [Dechloromonas denitrificans]|uniref:helix-turn-helix transcriptional regulator n=1 Tax=Dechloromonas denitrificans TaxID=281362 RepID=UPI0009F8F9F4|nr:AlpA family phage regulatory protein [Dechloromonas denitrificans]